MRALWLVIPISCLVLAGSAAGEQCCRLLKIDEEVPVSSLLVCENDGASGCGAVLFQGSLALGEAQEVCTQSDTLVYQEWDDELGSYGPPVVAVCDGADVEL